MSEFGIFSDEGIVAGGFYSREEALAFIASHADYEDVTVEEVCHDHPEHAQATCEECNAEEEDPS